MSTVSNIPEEHGARGKASVYRNKRQAEIVTAVKTLPFPVQDLVKEDENYTYFNKEASKLNALNDYPLNLVRVLNTGILEKGGSPYLEMEFIEGPHLEELLKTSFKPVFPLTEVINIASQIANAIAHCHHAGIIHGEIKDTNIRLNQHTGNYVLLGFGMALVPPKYRMQIFQSQAGSFYAPEQKKGDLLFQTDIYSYAVLLYHLLCGSFPGILPGEENLVESRFRLELINARRQNLPESWAEDRKERELNIPKWLTDLLEICLQKEPMLRFKTGLELQQYIADKAAIQSGVPVLSGGSYSILLAENERLNNLLHQQEEDEAVKAQEITRMKALLIQKDGQLDVYRYQSSGFIPQKTGVQLSKPALILLATLFAGLIGYAIYSAFIAEPSTRGAISTYADTLPAAESLNNIDSPETAINDRSAIALKESVKADTIYPESISIDKVPETSRDIKTSSEPKKLNKVPQSIPNKINEAARDKPSGEPSVFKARYDKYTLDVSKAYLHSEPDEGTKRNIFMADTHSSELTAVRDSNNFIYVIFFNTEGEIIRGWLRKKDLKRIN